MTVSTALKDIAKFLLFLAIYCVLAVFLLLVFDGISMLFMPRLVAFGIADSVSGLVAAVIGARILNGFLRPYPADMFSFAFGGLILANFIRQFVINGMSYYSLFFAAHFVLASATAWYLFHRPQKSN